MSSQPDFPSVTAWLTRLEAAWQRMPAEERTRQREEIEQHLEGLVAAKVAEGQPPQEAWEAALVQFGDPTQIGRKMYHEWQQNRSGFRMDMKAILFGFGLLVARYFVGGLLYTFWFDRLYNSSDKLYTHGQGVVGIALAVSIITAWGGVILIGVIIGRKYPLRAIKATLYSHLLITLVGWSQILAFYLHHKMMSFQPQWDQYQWAVITHSLFLTSLFATGYTAIAYLASVTKRGWYRPTLADFKITLPRRRYKIAK